MSPNLSSVRLRLVKVRFWLISPRRSRTRKGKVYRDARPALRVVASLHRGHPRVHVGWCSLPPTPTERAKFLVMCRARLQEHGVQHNIAQETVAGIEERLDHAVEQVATPPPDADGAHAALRLKALLLARGT